MEHDLVVIGGGAAGMAAARTAVRMRAAVGRIAETETATNATAHQSDGVSARGIVHRFDR